MASTSTVEEPLLLFRLEHSTVTHTAARLRHDTWNETILLQLKMQVDHRRHEQLSIVSSTTLTNHIALLELECNGKKYARSLNLRSKANESPSSLSELHKYCFTL